MRRLAPMADEIYADLKHMDSAAHRRMTGAGNERILRNLQALSGLDVPVTVRTPLIPGFNDGWENLTASARLAHDTGAQAYVLLPYNPMAGSKYPMLGRTFDFPQYEAQEKKEVEALCSRLNRECGWDGFVRTQK